MGLVRRLLAVLIAVVVTTGLLAPTTAEAGEDLPVLPLVGLPG